MGDLVHNLIINDSIFSLSRKESLSELHGYNLLVRDLSIWSKFNGKDKPIISNINLDI